MAAAAAALARSVGGSEEEATVAVKVVAATAAAGTEAAARAAGATVEAGKRELQPTWRDAFVGPCSGVSRFGSLGPRFLFILNSRNRSPPRKPNRFSL